MEQDFRESSGGKTVPGFAKMIMVLQTGVIFFLAFWVFQEFENNVYLQVYLNGLLQNSGVVLVALGSVGFFSVMAVLLFAKLRRTRKELDTVLTGEHKSPGKTAGFIDDRTEQHLIEMIRRTTPQPPGNPATGSPLPVLKREDQVQGSSDQPPT